jgi:hypothetical protein
MLRILVSITRISVVGNFIFLSFHVIRNIIVVFARSIFHFILKLSIINTYVCILVYVTLLLSAQFITCIFCVRLQLACKWLRMDLNEASDWFYWNQRQCTYVFMYARFGYSHKNILKYRDLFFVCLYIF